jgi:hypothetical protein
VPPPDEFLSRIFEKAANLILGSRAKRFRRQHGRLVAEDSTSVPVALTSIGLSLIRPPRIVFERSPLRGIIAKATDYEPRGPAVGSPVTFLQLLANRPGSR